VILHHVARLWVQLGRFAADEPILDLDPGNMTTEEQKARIRERSRIWMRQHPPTAEQRQRRNELAKEWRKRNPEKTKMYVKRWQERHPNRIPWKDREPVKYAWLNYRRAAKRRGLDWQLTKDEMATIIMRECNYCGQSAPNGIDRVDNDVGYIQLNVVTACTMCNMMKHTLGVNDFLSHVTKIHIHGKGVQ
jgi:hypothetical protein